MTTTRKYDPTFELFADSMRLTRQKTARGPIFTVPTHGLWDMFMDSLPLRERDEHKCENCKQFITRFGGLVAIPNNFNRIESILWDPSNLALGAESTYRRAVVKLQLTVEERQVNGIFLTRDEIMGTRFTNGWSHLSVFTPPSALVVNPNLSLKRLRSLNHEARYALERMSVKFGVEVSRKALAMLESGLLARAEKVLPMAKAYNETMEELELASRRYRDGAYVQSWDTIKSNIIWSAIAKDGTILGHISSSMLGCILEDLLYGVHPKEIASKYEERMNPLQYQRPQAPPKRDQVVAAERLVADLKSAGAFRRRFAKLEELDKVWVPGKERPRNIFTHLVKDPTPNKVLSGKTIPISVMEFVCDLLPGVSSLELDVPESTSRFTAFTTCSEDGAPPILQWDRPERRNQVAWFMYADASPAGRWNVESGFNKVTAVVQSPPHWGPNPLSNHPRQFVFILEGCRDLMYKAGGSLFPENMLPEYHGARAVIEAYSNSYTLPGANTTDACGYVVSETMVVIGTELRVKFNDGSVAMYKLIRWR